MATHIDLSEEFEQELITLYGSFCDELTENLGALYEELDEKCNETRFEPMVNLVNQTMDLFNDEVYSVALQSFDEWVDGEGSFPAAARKSEVGEDGEATAANIEQQIRDMFEDFWAGKPMGEGLQLDTSRPNVKSEDFDDLKELYQKHARAISSLGEDCIADLNSRGDDNPSFRIAIPGVKAVFLSIQTAFDGFVIKVDEAKEQSETKKREQDAHNEEASETATQTTASAADIADALKAFEDL